MVDGLTPNALIARHPRLGLDTNILIYLVQDHPRYGGWCTSLFEAIEKGRGRAVTSVITLLEALVQPYRIRDEELAQQFYGLLSTYPALSLAPVTLEVADHAAMLRARYRLSTPDAIQVATALERHATAFLGNDTYLKRITEIECLILDDIL